MLGLLALIPFWTYMLVGLLIAAVIAIFVRLFTRY